jgi:hypothetical protein
MNVITCSDFKDLLKNVRSGSISLQEPIVSHKDDSYVQLQKQPFQDYLLNFKNIKKDTLIHPLHTLFNVLGNQINKLQEDPKVGQMIININGEWFDNEGKTLQIDDPISELFLENQKILERKKQKTCSLCDDVENICHQEYSQPIESKLRGDHPNNRHADSAIIMCHDLAKLIKLHMEELKQIIKKVTSVDQNVLLELSQKLKSSYINDILDHTDFIPENIQQIFMNFLIVQNSLHKQLLINYKKLKNLLNELKDRCDNITSLKKDKSMIAQINIGDFLQDIISNKKDNQIVEIEPSSKKVSQKEIIQKLIEQPHEISSDDDLDDIYQNEELNLSFF